MIQSQTTAVLDYQSEAYRNTFSRINGIVIEGEQEAHDNFMCLARLLPDHENALIYLGKIEGRHRKSFEACGRNLKVLPDLKFAYDFFADLRQAFETAAAAGKIATCLLIQSLVIECFAIAAYNNYIPVADPFAQKVTESVVTDEYDHLDFGEEWLRQHFDEVKEELQTANREILPIIWRMLNQVEADAKAIGMDKDALLRDFVMRYGDSLCQIGFSTREIMRMASHGLVA